jgi:hypothetical protein
VTLFALIGAKALFLLYLWLLVAIISSYLSERKGYSEKPGLACGLLLHLIGLVIWLVWPPKPGSKWKTIGPVGRAKSPATARREAATPDA